MGSVVKWAASFLSAADADPPEVASPTMQSRTAKPHRQPPTGRPEPRCLNWQEYIDYNLGALPYPGETADSFGTDGSDRVRAHESRIRKRRHG